MSTEQFVAALTEYRLDPTEIADVFWLALHQIQLEESDDQGADSGAVDEAGQTEEDLEDIDDLDRETGPDTGNQEEEEEDDKATKEESFDIAPEFPTGILPKKALPISVPDADILDETLPLVRALKPILKQIKSQTFSCINEADTVDRIAETDIWSPVLEPEQEPWFDVALVIDNSPGMSIWQRLIQDITRLLRCYGSFRDLRVWQLAKLDGEVSISTVPEFVRRSPNALLPPDSRRLILLFSDCTADYWWDGSLYPILSLWGESTPTAVWQVLPDWMWKRTALGVGDYVSIRNHLPGARNTKLTPIYLSLMSSMERSGRRSVQEMEPDTIPIEPPPICIPVITSEHQSLGDWSRMLGGDRRYSTPGFLLPATGWVSGPETPSDGNDESQPQKDPLDTFRLRSTPAARRLAALLAAAPVITLPVMRLIRASDEFLPGSSPLPVAEVFLGGLLKQSPDQPDSASPELVQYTFPDQVRDRLLDILPKVDAVEVIEAVSQHVAEHLNCTLADFRALLLSPDLKDEADRYGLRSFAKMTAQILRKIGLEEFHDLVQRLEQALEHKNSNSTDTDSNDDWLSGFSHHTLSYEVVEYLDFSPLEPFEFIDARLINESDPPPFPPSLETEPFTVITLESLPPGPSPQLESFPITIATLVNQQGQWQLQTQQHTAHRYIETLPNDRILEMVAIPGGTFLMGSPEAEPERYGDESPQHEVSIASFFMGRYPITQAQWKSVATLPQMERELELDPSHFKGDTRPVERVSWYEAVEFCARLSAHTGRDYRLPTEAEWEYACRAGTTTPFHFGHMITTDVANYDGSAYAKGPEGESRGETTPVDHFGYANAIGLSDMHGNVFEWCQDHWHGTYEEAPIDGSAWLTHNKEESQLRRGGSWVVHPRVCRSAFRTYISPVDRGNTVGFRVSCSAPRSLS